MIIPPYDLHDEAELVKKSPPPRWGRGGLGSMKDDPEDEGNGDSQGEPFTRTELGGFLSTVGRRLMQSHCLSFLPKRQRHYIPSEKTILEDWEQRRWGGRPWFWEKEAERG